MINEKIIFKNIQKITEDHLSDILLHMVKLKASDIYLHSGELILMDIYGLKTNVTEIPTTFTTIEDISKKIAGKDAITRLNSGEFINLEYEEKHEGKRYRFRINLTPTRSKGQSGVQITIREIPITIPTLEDSGLDKSDPIYKNCFPSNGLVLITGPTGSGKSTLMAACIGAKLQELDCHKIFNSYEAPIEFVYDSLYMPSARIFQTSVRNVDLYGDYITNSLRRKPEVIIVGELRDTAAIAAAIEAGQTGHLLISTLHTNGVPNSVKRLITKFPAGERDSRQFEVLDQLHMIVSQKLLKTIDGKRVAVREKLIFTQKIKDELSFINPLLINNAIRDIMTQQNEGIVLRAKELFDLNIISLKEYENVSGEFSSI